MPIKTKKNKNAPLHPGNDRGQASDLEDGHRGLRVQSLAGRGDHGELWKVDTFYLPRVGQVG